jgi:PAS domain-containing protein
MYNSFMFGGKSQMAKEIFTKDWSKSSIGPITNWPIELKISLNLLLSSPMPSSLYWGPEYIMFYNDDFKPLLGDRHPDCLGKQATEVWREIWDLIGDEYRSVYYSGKSIIEENKMVPLFQGDKLIDHYWDYTRVPIYNGDRISGIYNSSIDVTTRVLNRAKLAKQNRELNAIFDSSSIGICLLDGRNFTYLRVNNKHCEIMDSSRENLIGHSVFEKVNDIHGLRNFLDIAANGTAVRNKVVEASTLLEPNVIKKWQIEYIPIFDSENIVESIIGMAVEVLY